MSPLQFEREYAPLWSELEALLGPVDDVEGAPGSKKSLWARFTGQPEVRPDAARLADLYRRSCEHLALARDRAYPLNLVQRLEKLTERAHALVYARSDAGAMRLKRLALVDFPQSVRAHASYVWAAAALFVVPMLLMAWACWRDPGFILHVLDSHQVQAFDRMYGDAGRSIGARDASDDWMMFGHYIRNNIGIAFQCFASGLLVGIGSVFFTVYNGVMIGAVAGYLTSRGLGGTFFPFVVTHGAFELTAIVLAAAAGLRLGHAIVAPGRFTRRQSLVRAAPRAVVLVYGVTAMLLVAAAVEAFWSSSRWVTDTLKYAVGASCWILMLAYLVAQGRPADGKRPSA